MVQAVAEAGRCVHLDLRICIRVHVREALPETELRSVLRCIGAGHGSLTRFRSAQPLDGIVDVARHGCNIKLAVIQRDRSLHSSEELLIGLKVA